MHYSFQVQYGNEETRREEIERCIARGKVDEGFPDSGD